MATPIPDSYAAASGKPIYAGRLAPIAEVIDQQYGKYRYQSPQLFQTAAAAVYPTRVSGGNDLDLDTNGPRYYSVSNGWNWDNPGGDWLDATGTRQGSTPWCTVMADKVSGSEAIADYSMDCTTLMQYVQVHDRWNALFMDCGAPRSIAGVFNTTHAKPAINVTYVGGATATLNCKVTARCTNSASNPGTTGEGIGLPIFLEFDKPTAPVQSATMTFTFLTHWSGGTPTVKVFLLDPPINTNPTVMGVAAAAELDASLPTDPSIIGVHRYVDGVSLSSFTQAGTAVSSGFAFDPYITQGSPTHDYTKYPHLGLGKFINPHPDWEMVTSAYSGEGYEALAPGMGAIKVPMPHDPAIVDGFEPNNSNGTSAASSYIFMPEPLLGYLSHIFVRYYMRIGTPNGTPYRMPKAQIYQTRQAIGSTPQWADCAGKMGITPCHMTTNGGNSGSSGGGWGWEMRHAWRDCYTDDTGPEVGGWNVGLHMDDFRSYNPPGYQYGGGGAQSFNDTFSQQGGLGGTMLADKWYCVETELKLNTVFPEAPGFTPDGELRVWVDGRLATEKTGMVFRSLPLQNDLGINPAYRDNYIDPVRELGVKHLWFNWYHGGNTQNTIPRTMFVTGVAWGTSYIGPMKLPAPAAPDLPAWRAGQSVNEWREIAGSSMSNFPPSIIMPGYSGTGPSSKMDAWCGLSIDTRTSTVISLANGGHLDYLGNEYDRFNAEADTPVWEEMFPSSTTGAIGNSLARYPDGKPASAHTYYSQQYIERRNRAMRFGLGAVSGDGNANADTATTLDAFDTTVAKGVNGWDAVGTWPKWPQFSTDMPVCKNPLTEDVYCFNFNNAVYKWTEAINAISTLALGGSGYPPGSMQYAASAFDTARGRIFLLSGFQAKHTFDISTMTFTARTLTGTVPSISSGESAAMIYEPVTDKYLLMNVFGVLYEIDPVSFASVVKTVTGPTPTQPITTGGGSPYTRLLYAPNLGGVLWFPRYSSNAWFLRTH